MARYPANLEERHVLADGRVVTVRPVRADDEAAESAFFARLCAEAKRLRFMKFVGAVNQRLIHSFTHLDYEGRMAFVCEHRGEIVGEARYSAIPQSRGCDFGIVIADAWHKSGIAGLLMDALMRQARAQGFDTMESIVLRENRPMLKFARALGFELRPNPADPSTVQIFRRLAPCSPPGVEHHVAAPVLRP